MALPARPLHVVAPVVPLPSARHHLAVDELALARSVRAHPAGAGLRRRRLSSQAARLEGAGSTVIGVRCPACGDLEDKVIDSRMAEDGASIRRRRQCLGCEQRFTTFERLEAPGLLVQKRSGDVVPFDRSKVEAGILAASTGRPIDEDLAAELTDAIEDRLRAAGPEVPSEQIGLAVLDALRDVDEVAYMRFASVYKDFDDAADFQRELTLLTKRTDPKRR